MKRLSFAAILIFFITIFSKIGEEPSRLPSGFKERNLDCVDQITHFLEDNYSMKLLLALEDKKYIHKRFNKIVIRKPSRSWLQNIKDSYHRTLKYLNKKKHSIYYLDADETLTSLNVYPDLFAKKLKGEEDGAEVLEKVDNWVAKYKNYTTDIDNLYSERASLAYNISLLKRIRRDVKKAFNEGREYTADITLHINGKEVPRRYIFRKEDANYTYELGKLVERRKQLDGGVFDVLLNSGEITERIIEQARLHDIVRMHHRELEYYVNNTENIEPAIKEKLVAKLKELEALERGYKENKELLPSEFGIKKIQDRKIMTELKNLPRSIKSRDFIKKPEKVVEKYMDEKSKQRLQYHLKGFARLFQATGVGAAGYALFETGNIAKAAITWYFYDKNRVDECNNEAIDDGEAFRACLINYVKERHPFIYQRRMVDPNFDMFDLENLANDIPGGQRDSYIEFMDKALSKRAYYMMMLERDMEISMDMDKAIQLKEEEMSKNLDLNNLNPCTTVPADYLAGCIWKYLSKVFGGTMSLESSNNLLEKDYMRYDLVPERHREKYIEEVEKLLNERTKYEHYKEELIKSDEYKSLTDE